MEELTALAGAVKQENNQGEPESNTTTATIKNEQNSNKLEENTANNPEKKATLKPPQKEKAPSPFPVEGFPDEENMW